jgi:hypothetical protein
MAKPFIPTYPIIHGDFVMSGYEPDGDSVRFIADDKTLYLNLHRNYRIRPSPKDGSVQLRFEGIDATELHYGSAAQPLGAEARDVLLALMGFRNIRYASTQPTRVISSTPAKVRGAILALSAEANGRPVSYVLLGTDAVPGNSVRVDEALLQKTMNYQMLNNGLAYYTVYRSMPLAHRNVFRNVADKARRANSKGSVWAIDQTSEFVLDNQDSIGPKGQCILPKLFRRCTDYLKAVEKGFIGNLADWIISVSSTPSRNENDEVIVLNHQDPQSSIKVKLTDLIVQSNRKVSLQGDLLDLVFVEK